MNTVEDDELKRLWRDTPPVDVEALLTQLRAINLAQRRMNIFAAVAGWIVVAGSAAAEAAGFLPTRGAATVALAAALLAAHVYHRRAKARLDAAFSAEPERLDRFLEGRLRAGLLVARMLYAGVPLSALSGALLSRLLPADGVGSMQPGGMYLVLSVAALTLASLVTLGLVLAHSRAVALRRLLEQREARTSL